MICCVLKASCADSSDGKDKASSLELVCNDCVPPKIADAACIVVLTILLSIC